MPGTIFGGFVVIELKLGAFRLEHAGEMSFYLSAVDELLRHPNDERSIGLVLCKTRKRLIVEYALRDLGKPVGVSSYDVKWVEALPEEWRGRLPSIAELERGFDTFRAQWHKTGGTVPSSLARNGILLSPLGPSGSGGAQELSRPRSDESARSYVPKGSLDSSEHRYTIGLPRGQLCHPR